MTDATFLRLGGEPFDVAALRFGSRFADEALAAKEPSRYPPALLNQSRFARYEAENDKALTVLAGASATKKGQLPIRPCRLAFQVWEPLEVEIKGHLQGIDRKDLELNLGAAWFCLVSYNLANLSLADESSSWMLRKMAKGQIGEATAFLGKAAVTSSEAAIERSLAYPPPTSNLRRRLGQIAR